MKRARTDPSPTVNPLAERSLLSDAQLARWKGYPVGWVQATPELVGRCGNDGDLLLAMLDTGAAQAEFRFGCRVLSHTLAADDIGLFAPGDHADLTHWRCEGVRRIMLRITRSQLNDDSLAERLFEAPPRTKLVFRDPALAAVLRAMVAEVRDASPHGELYAESLSLGVALQLRRHTPAGAARERGRLDARQLGRLRELIRSRMAHELNLGELAAEVGLGRAQFVRLFKASAGCTPYQFVLQVRLQTAHDQLLHSSLSLAEVAHAVGFSSQSHMTTLFRRRYGLTPGELRRSCR